MNSIKNEKFNEMKTIKLPILILVAMLFATSGCEKDYTIHQNEIAAIKDNAALKSKKVKPPPAPVSYAITGDMEGYGPANNITLTLGAAFAEAIEAHPGPYTGRVTMAWFSYGREKGMRLNFIMADESYAFVVEHYQKHPKAVFGIFYPDDPWRMVIESGSSPVYPETGFLIKGITVTVIQE